MLLIGRSVMPFEAGQRHAAPHLGHLQGLPLTERFEMGSGSELLCAAPLAPCPQQTGQHPQCPLERLVTFCASVANLPALRQTAVCIIHHCCAAWCKICSHTVLKPNRLNRTLLSKRALTAYCTPPRKQLIPAHPRPPFPGAAPSPRQMASSELSTYQAALPRGKCCQQW